MMKGGATMRLVFFVTVLLFASNILAGNPAPINLSFDKGKIGEMPPGWKAGVTGKGATASVWKLAEDKTAPGGGPVLFQTSKNSNAAFNVCIAQDGGKYKDIDITIAL